MRAWVSLLFVLTALAGCLEPTEDSEPLRERLSADGYAASLVANIPAIQWDATAAVDWWADFASGNMARDAFLPQNAQAREYLASELERIGYEVDIRGYEVNDQAGEATTVYAVVGTKAGSGARGDTSADTGGKTAVGHADGNAAGPEHRIGLVSHYDTQTLTLQGAYDDASGVAASFAICEALARVETERSISCIFFDGEEIGLVASERYVEDVTAGDEDFVYDFILGYDMVGINWPGHDWKLYAMVGENFVPELFPFANQLLHEALLLPAEGVEVLDVHDRNSDERRFKEAEIPILRFAGGRHASDYPAYHMPHDTVEFVYQFAGGRADFEQGFATVVETSYSTILALDQTDVETLRDLFA